MHNLSNPDAVLFSNVAGNTPKTLPKKDTITGRSWKYNSIY